MDENIDEVLDEAYLQWMERREVRVRNIRGIVLYTTSDPYGASVLIANPYEMLNYFVGLN